ncbi:MAG: hypothetical protein ACR2IV_23035 [Bryobacteraceae bacterium]
MSFGTPEQTQRTIAAIQEDGTCWCGGTVWKNRTAIRISVSNWSTTDEDVDKSLDAIIRAAAQFARYISDKLPPVVLDVSHRQATEVKPT